MHVQSLINSSVLGKSNEFEIRSKSYRAEIPMLQTWASRSGDINQFMLQSRNIEHAALSQTKCREQRQSTQPDKNSPQPIYAVIQLILSQSHANFFVSIPLSTGMTVKLNFAIVSPNRSSTLGCHFSENLSSLSIGFRSSILPPKIVNMVAELSMCQYLKPSA